MVSVALYMTLISLTQSIFKVVHHGKVDVSHVQAKFHSAMAVIAERTEVLVSKT